MRDKIKTSTLIVFNVMFSPLVAVSQMASVADINNIKTASQITSIGVTLYVEFSLLLTSTWLISDIVIAAFE